MCGVDNAPQCGSFGAQEGASALETNGGAKVYPKPCEGGNEGVGQQLEWPWEGTTHPAAFSVIVRNGVAAEWNLRGSWVAGAFTYVPPILSLLLQLLQDW